MLGFDAMPEVAAPEAPTFEELIVPREPPRMAWVLIGIPTVRFGEIAALVEQVAALPEVVVETSVNDG